jgi:ANTAR domain-containing protein
LTSRVIIEQAKGVLSQRFDIDVEEAFDRLRRYARSRNEKPVDIAGKVVQRELDLAGPAVRVRGHVDQQSTVIAAGGAGVAVAGEAWTSCSGTPAPRASVIAACRSACEVTRSAVGMPVRRASAVSARAALPGASVRRCG